MIDATNKEKAELIRLVKGLGSAINHKCDGETEPCASIHRAARALNLFLSNQDNFKSGLTLADVGQVFDEMINCRCHELEPKFDKGHHPDCDLWDPKEGG